jgi:hypothetical protein
MLNLKLFDYKHLNAELNNTKYATGNYFEINQPMIYSGYLIHNKSSL